MPVRWHTIGEKFSIFFFSIALYRYLHIIASNSSTYGHLECCVFFFLAAVLLRCQTLLDILELIVGRNKREIDLLCAGASIYTSFDRYLCLSLALPNFVSLSFSLSLSHSHAHFASHQTVQFRRRQRLCVFIGREGENWKNKKSKIFCHQFVAVASCLFIASKSNNQHANANPNVHASNNNNNCYI